MLRVLASDGIEKGAAKKLEELGLEVVQQFYEPDELAEQVKQFDVLVVRSATKVREPIIDSALTTGRLKLIIRGGVGVDNIDVAYARERGIAVCNTPNASSASVAELAIGHMFSLARFIGIANYTMREGRWEKKAYKGVEIAGKTLGLIGIGRIARETGKRAMALGMNVIYTNRSGHKPEYEPFVRYELDEMLPQCDYVSLHTPGPKGTPPILSAEKIGLMKKGAFLINTGRGNMVDTNALLDALDAGNLRGYGVDVYEQEPCTDERLLKHPLVSMTPHVGGSTVEAQERIGEEIVAHICREFNL
ncbi:D-2-hydroxyacid dehydrogenase [Eubacteriales bacterium OttesenSCG-928-K08]|nr:D-2-hydroxyacid dehydrogenase [Eubacteriales bacterium OttesenSCG-928-K08]